MPDGKTAQTGMNPQQHADNGMGSMMCIMMFTLLILMDRNLRNALGELSGAVLSPAISFDNTMPVITIFIASIIMIVFNTVIRHKYTDWITMAENQKYMSAFNKVLREARLKNNMARYNKLISLQPEILKKQQAVSAAQMKPMSFTMIIAISIFTWLGVFVSDLDYKFFSVPWDNTVYFNASLVFPVWILMYSLFSLPVGQALQKALKYVEMKKELEKPSIKKEKPLENIHYRDYPVKEKKYEVVEGIISEEE